MKSLINAAATLFVTCALSACGGGGPDLGPIGNPLTSGKQHYDVTNFNWTASTDELSVTGSPAPSNITFSWTGNRVGGLPAYTFSVHMVPSKTGSSATLDSSNAIVVRNCGPQPMDCDQAGQASCNYVLADGGIKRLECGATNVRNVAAGQYDLVAQVCSFRENLDDFCYRVVRSLLLD